MKPPELEAIFEAWFNALNPAGDVCSENFSNRDRLIDAFLEAKNIKATRFEFLEVTKPNFDKYCAGKVTRFLAMPRKA